MVTVTFQGTPAEINRDIHAFLNLSTRAATTPAHVPPPVPEKAPSELLSRYESAPEPRTPDVVAAPSEEPKRKRRTKAEMEALKAEKAKANQFRNPEEPFTAKVHDNGATQDDESADDESPAIVQVQKAAATGPLTKEVVHQALQQVNVAVGLPKAREILSSFGANRISDVKPDQFTAFVEKCNEAVMMV